ncbi:LysE family translocator [Paracoccus sp. (in: a-proteobacteria)]|uniref:LysE family translocator n=1 Tax=Paracoccus sp. TaxID=267 RepID=UPI003A873EC9
MAPSDVLTFVVIATLLVISPGPNGVLIARTVPGSGRRAGFANVAGFITAFYLHGTLSILGISIILVQSATAFAIVKYLGAAYLCWVGIRAILSAIRQGQPVTDTPVAKRKRSLRGAYVEGFLTNALNPKVSMFYLAAFPQFISQGTTPAAAAFFLVFLHSMINAVWFGAMVMLFSTVSRSMKNAAFQRHLKIATGVIFIGFGARLAALKSAIP